MSRLARLRSRRPGRVPTVPGRRPALGQLRGRHTHHVAVLSGPTIGEWGAGGPPLARLVVGLHGLGADERQFATLLPLELPVRTLYVGLRAPLAYGRDGYSWYDPTLEASQIDQGPVVDRLADAVATIQERTGVSASATTLIGYSQAAGLAVATSALRHEVADGIVLGSAALPPGLATLGPGRPRRALVAIGAADPFVDPDSVDELLSAWSSIPGGCSTRTYDVPHVMSPSMARDISTWVRDDDAG